MVKGVFSLVCVFCNRHLKRPTKSQSEKFHGPFDTIVNQLSRKRERFWGVRKK